MGHTLPGRTRRPSQDESSPLHFAGRASDDHVAHVQTERGLGKRLPVYVAGNPRLAEDVSADAEDVIDDRTAGEPALPSAPEDGDPCPFGSTVRGTREKPPARTWAPPSRGDRRSSALRAIS